GITLNPVPLATQTIKSAVHLTCTYFDPHQELPLSKVARVGGITVFQIAAGANPIPIVVSLVVDQTYRHYIFDEIDPGYQDVLIAPLKALITQDPERQVTSGIVSLACRKIHSFYTSQISCDTLDNWGATRTVKILCSNDSFQSFCVEWFIKWLPSDPSIPPEEKPTQPFDPAAIQPKPEPPEVIDLSFTVKQEGKEFHVYQSRPGHDDKQIGSFSSQAEANSWAEKETNQTRIIHFLNLELYHLHLRAYALGILISDLPTVTPFVPLYFSLNAPDKRVKLYQGNTKILDESNGKALTHAKTQVALRFNGQVVSAKNQLKNFEAALNGAAPPHLLPPQGLHEVIHVKQGNEHIYVSGMNQYGETTLIGIFKDPQEADNLAYAKAHYEVTTLDQENRCFQMQVKAFEQGIPIDQIPKIPQLKTPDLKGVKSDRLQPHFRGAEIVNESTTKAFIEQMNQLLSEPFQPDKMTTSEIHTQARSCVPPINSPGEHSYNPDHGYWYNLLRNPRQAVPYTNRWLNDHGIDVNVIFGTSIPLYPSPKPVATHSATQIDLALEKESPSKTSPPPTWTWEDLQAHETASLFQTLNSRPSPQPSSTSPPSFDPTQVDALLRESWGPGVVDPSPSSITLPSMQTAGFAPTLTSPMLASLFPVMDPSILMHSTEENQKLHIALNNDFVKSIPKGVGKVAVGILKFMVPDMSDFPDVENPHEHINRACQFLEIRYDELVHMEDPNSFAAKAGVFVGEIGALGSVGKLVRLAELPALFSTISEGAVVGAIIAEADNHDPLQGAVTGAAIGGSLHKVIGWLHLPSSPKSSEMILEFRPSLFPPKAGLPRQAVSTSLGERTPSMRISGNTLHPLPNIEREALREIATLKGSNRLDVIVRNSCNSRNLNESQIRSILRQNGFNPPPRPPGIPENCKVRISEKNGGIVYIKPGTLERDCIHVRIMPANPESINPMHHRPYVVQRLNNKAFDHNGKLVDWRSPESHIPLEEFKFKEW
ncbi:MAG: hypothetical protein AB7S94_05770, partial [Simkaniaceae bacterium]